MKRGRVYPAEKDQRQDHVVLTWPDSSVVVKS